MVEIRVWTQALWFQSPGSWSLDNTTTNYFLFDTAPMRLSLDGGLLKNRIIACKLGEKWAFDDE